MNFGKKVKCEVCGTRNWSGTEYCEKCSSKLDYANIENVEKKLEKKVG